MQLKHRKGDEDLMQMVGLIEVVDQFAMPKSVYYYMYVLMMDYGNVMRRH